MVQRPLLGERKWIVIDRWVPRTQAQQQQQHKTGIETLEIQPKRELKTGSSIRVSVAISFIVITSQITSPINYVLNVYFAWSPARSSFKKLIIEMENRLEMEMEMEWVRRLDTIPHN